MQNFEGIDYEAALSSVLNMSEKEINRIEKYVATFSWFLRDSDDAYQYNRVYLLQQNERFQQFISRANKKKLRLSQLMEKIKDIYINEPKFWTTNSEMYITLNNFWRADLMGSISICEEPSFLAVMREDKADMLTIHYQDKVTSCLLDSSESYIIQLVLGMMGIDREVETVGK